MIAGLWFWGRGGGILEKQKTASLISSITRSHLKHQTAASSDVKFILSRVHIKSVITEWVKIQIDLLEFVSGKSDFPVWIHFADHTGVSRDRKGNWHSDLACSLLRQLLLWSSIFAGGSGYIDNLYRDCSGIGTHHRQEFLPLLRSVIP